MQSTSRGPLPVPLPVPGGRSMVYGTALGTPLLSEVGLLLALTGLVKVDDEEAAAHTAGVVVLAAAREEGRAAEVALPAVAKPFAFPSPHYQVDFQQKHSRLSSKLVNG